MKKQNDFLVPFLAFGVTLTDLYHCNSAGAKVQVQKSATVEIPPSTKGRRLEGKLRAFYNLSRDEYRK